MYARVQRKFAGKFIHWQNGRKLDACNLTRSIFLQLLHVLHPFECQHQSAVLDLQPFEHS